MTVNPIIELIRHPVESFALLGTIGALLTASILAVIWPVRAIPALWADYQQRERDRDWYEGPRGIGWVPPLAWILMTASVPASVAIFGFAMSALAWVLT